MLNKSTNIMRYTLLKQITLCHFLCSHNVHMLCTLPYPPTTYTFVKHDISLNDEFVECGLLACSFIYAKAMFYTALPHFSFSFTVALSFLKLDYTYTFQFECM